jgi:adenylosuccinate synthase
MKADVVVGLQFGSEAKGAAISRILHFNSEYDMSMRVQSTQAGHTVYYKDKEFKMQSIPCAWTNPNVELLLGPGCFTERELLLKEIKDINTAIGGDVRDRLFVDKRVFEVTQEDKNDEIACNLQKAIGSTAHGCGASLFRKLWRLRGKDNEEFLNWCFDNKIKVADTIERMQNAYVLVEGCQGAMLSIHTSPYFPFVTSREATVSGILGECGIAPPNVNHIFGIFRTLPIRVGGNSGPTGGKELTWDEVSESAGYTVMPEQTSVTRRIRRIFKFSDSDMLHAIRVNRPTHLMMTFANYIVPCVGVRGWKELSPTAQQVLSAFISHVNILSQDVGNRGKVIDMNTGPYPDQWIRV